MMEKSSSTSVQLKKDAKINIKDLRPQLTSFELIAIVVEIDPNSHVTKKGIKVKNCRIADKTGSVKFSVWGDYCDVIQPGDILQLTRCYTALFKGCLTVYVGKEGLIRKIGELRMLFSIKPDMSAINPEWLRQNYENKLNSSGPQKDQASCSYKTQQDSANRDKSDF